MNNRQQIIYLLQVVIPFCLLSLFQSTFFLIPVVVVILALPLRSARNFLIRYWMLLGTILGKIISPIVLSIVYYLGLTPLALLRRLTGSDELNLRKPLNTNLKVVNERLTTDRFDDLW